MWDWFLTHLWILLALLSTFIYVRALGALLRRLVPRASTKNWGSAEAVVCYALGTTLPATALLVLRRQGLVWVSATALWVSLLLDALSLLGLMIYLLKLRRLRRAPEHFIGEVSLRPADNWPGPKVIAGALTHLALKIPLLNRRLDRTLAVSPGDFRRFLRSDLRLVDHVTEVEALPEIPPADLLAMPHLFLPDSARGEDGGADTTDIEDIVDEITQDLNVGHLSTGTLHLVNRTLNSRLPEDLWRASRDLCRNMPYVVANTWKQFHAQETLHLRLVALFNTADLVQRLIGSIVLSTLRDSGELHVPADGDGHPSPEKLINKWNLTLRWALETSTTPKLNCLRELMLAPRDDFDSLRGSLEPLWKIVGRAAIDYPGERNTLAGLSVLSILRNKLIGHGGIGWQLNLRPTVYLSALHSYFIALMRDVAALDLGVSAGRGVPGMLVAGEDRGLIPEGYFGDDCLATVALPDGQGFAVLNPYLRFHNGRLLVLNRVYKPSPVERADYVDYNVRDVTEPSFISFNERLRSFLESGETRDFSLRNPSPEQTERYQTLATAEAKVAKARAYFDKGNAQAALPSLNNCIKICRRLEREESRPEWRALQADALKLKGDCLLRLSQTWDAVECWEQAAALYENLLHEYYRPDLAIEAARARLYKSYFLRTEMNSTEGRPDCDMALSHLDHLVNHEGHVEFSYDLAFTLYEKGLIEELDGTRQSPAYYDKAVAQLKQPGTKSDSRSTALRAKILYSFGWAVHDQNKPIQAIQKFEEALAIRKRLLAEGDVDQVEGISLILASMGLSFIELGRTSQAVGCLQEAFTAAEALEPEFRSVHVSKLVGATGDQISALLETDRHQDALDLCQILLDQPVGAMKSEGAQETVNALVSALRDQARKLENGHQVEKAFELNQMAENLLKVT